MNDTRNIRPLRTEVSWIPVPSCFTDAALELSYLFLELKEIGKRHRYSAVRGVIDTRLELSVVSDKVMDRLGQSTEVQPNFDIAWRDGEVNLRPVYHSFTNLPDQRSSSPYLLLSNTRDIVPGEYEQVNLVFVRTDSGWEPFATNADGLMAAVVSYYLQYEFNTPLGVVTTPLWQLRGLTTTPPQ